MSALQQGAAPQQGQLQAQPGCFDSIGLYAVFFNLLRQLLYLMLQVSL
jgi:hypothetical protein